MEKIKLAIVRFVNAKHGRLISWIFASFGFLGTFVLTQNYQLSQKSYQDFAYGNLKTGARRAAWLSKTMLNFDVFFDDNEFDFAQGLSVKSLSYLENRLYEKLSALEPHSEKAVRIQADLTYIWMNIVDKAPERYSEIRPKFSEAVDNIINYKLDPDYVYAENNKPKSPKPPLNIDFACAALIDFQREMDKISCEWFLVSGTFLGMIRENSFLKHDYDLDFGLFGEGLDHETFIGSLTSSEKFSIRRIDYQRQYEFKNDQMNLISKTLACVKLTHHTGLFVDLFVHYHDGENIWHGSNLHRWDNTKFELADYDFMGLTVKGAKDYNLYLTENYGNWRTPLTDFHLSSGTPNLRIVNNLQSLSLCVRRIYYSQNKAEFENQIRLLQMNNFLNEAGEFSFLNPMKKSKK